MPPTAAGCSFQGSILLMGQTTETESGASVAESEGVTGTRKSGETNSLLETAFFVNFGQNKALQLQEDSMRG